MKTKIKLHVKQYILICTHYAYCPVKFGLRELRTVILFDHQLIYLHFEKRFGFIDKFLVRG